MKLRNMTGIYLTCKGQMLLLYRQNGRVVSDKWVASAGGHFEDFELNDPKACVLRELNEELGLCEEDIRNLKMRYIALRNTKGEIRQNYYFFADLDESKYGLFESCEGKCKWVDIDKVPDYEMPLTAEKVMEHYLKIGRFTDHLYCACCEGEHYSFSVLAES